MVFFATQARELEFALLGQVIVLNLYETGGHSV